MPVSWKSKLSAQFILIWFSLMVVDNLQAQNYTFQKDLFENYIIVKSKQMPDSGFTYVLVDRQRRNFQIIRTKKNDDFIWAKEYSTLGCRIDIANLFLDSNKNYLLVGRIIDEDSLIDGVGSWKILFMKLDSSGNINISKIYFCDSLNNGSKGYFNYFKAKEKNNFIYIAGDISGYYANSFLLKIDKLGELVWCTKNQMSASQGFDNLTFDTENVYCVGFIFYSSDSIKNIISKFGFDGNLKWKKEYSLESYELNLWDIEYSNDGNLYIGGVYYTGLPVHPWYPAMIKADTSGQIKWINYYEGDYHVAETFDIAVTDDYGVIQELEIENFSNTSPTGALKTNKDGKVEWTIVYKTNYVNFPYSFEINNDKSLSITGYTYGNYNGGYVIKTDADYKTNCNDTLIQVETKQLSLSQNNISCSLVYGAFEDTISISSVPISIIPDTVFCIDTFMVQVPIEPPVPPHPIDSCIYYTHSIEYPNPSDDFITIEFISDCVTQKNILIYNVIGQLILKASFTSENKFIFRKNQFVSGMYLYSIDEKETGKTLTKGKLVFF